MIEKWIQSIFIKRASLAIAAAVVAQWTAHQVITVDRLATWGIHLTMVIDQKTFAEHLTVLFVGLSQGLHEWIAAKYPEAGKYL